MRTGALSTELVVSGGVPRQLFEREVTLPYNAVRQRMGAMQFDPAPDHADSVPAAVAVSLPAAPGEPRR